MIASIVTASGLKALVAVIASDPPGRSTRILELLSIVASAGLFEATSAL